MQVKRKVSRRAEPRFNFTLQEVKQISAARSEPDWLAEHRVQAWKHWEQLPFPTLTEEAWRRTDLRQIPSDRLSRRSSNGVPLDEELKRLAEGESDPVNLIMQPGRPAQATKAKDLEAQGVIFADWERAVTRHGEEIREALGTAVPSDQGKFSALAAAMAQEGAVVIVPPNVQVEQPLHSILWAPSGNAANFSRLLVIVGEGSSLTYLHESASPADEDEEGLHAGIVELLVGQGAQLTFVEIQNWGRQVWNFTHERAKVARDASVDWIFGAVGSRLTKNFSDLSLDGRGASGRMSGFFFADGRQHLDHDTQQNHMAPDTTSDLLFKGALIDHSRSVWQGMIYVAPGAQRTDGYQANRNLLLSKQARADSIPGLEILADDVRCTHGATVSQLEQEPIFYLMTRGLSRTEAERLVVEGFFTPILDRVPLEGVKARFERMIDAKLGTP